MRALVIGAPKSGKTRFANKFGKERNVKVFDGLDKKFIKKTELALGELSDYRTDFMFVSDILALEYKNRKEDYIITAGPLYSYLHFLFKAGFNENDKALLENMGPLMMMASIALDSLWYDEIYYLPYKKDEEDTFSFYIDKGIKDTIKEFKLEEKITTIE